ncbi:MAG: glycosyltransferase family 4 protein [Parcubacteria group bacterium]|nr:glycosyltransferase family 4 protein [Parcubacteria group bacterium]
MKLLYLYANARSRSEIENPSSGSYKMDYALFGANHANTFGHQVIETTETQSNSEKKWIGIKLNFLLNKFIKIIGGYGGDWFKILTLKRSIAKTDIIISTSDRVGIPLILLMKLGLIEKKPILYISIGLPKRLKKMRGIYKHFFISSLTQHVDSIVCYGWQEAQTLKELLKDKGDIVTFVPFGVQVDLFRPISEETTQHIVSIGADPHRDFELLISIAHQIPSPITIVTNAHHARVLEHKLSPFPKNISIIQNLAFEKMKDLMDSASLIVLPVKENSYSGATTTLLQAMALEKPVIVTETEAIKNGYHLKDGHNCLLVEPGNSQELLHKILLVCKNTEFARNLGKHARITATEQLSWKNFEEKIFSLIRACL